MNINDAVITEYKRIPLLLDKRHPHITEYKGVFRARNEFKIIGT